MIGITGPRRGARGPRSCVHLGVLLAGGRPLHLRPGDERDTAPLDGVIITGGHDVEPALYREEAEVVGNYDPERDAFEADIIDCALADGTPLLGICRGAQLLNVRRGGSLFQDLRKHRQRTSKRRTLLALKTLCVSSGSRLRALLGADTVRINSLHNQSIDAVGDGLAVCGRDLDDIVQAVEEPDHRFLLGVQWHPEFLIYSARQRRLFRHLVAAARDYRRHRRDEP
ncbi:MAG: gamma-glutamyl-gamma-aminobutyrate hydrolase family protein [Woeseiaceae bacterium]|nr:gamma-glutamyl-gamma-aminobutyrate hydrolase family protein [Woeseiaceae bacterium]